MGQDLSWCKAQRGCADLQLLTVRGSRRSPVHPHPGRLVRSNSVFGVVTRIHGSHVPLAGATSAREVGTRPQPLRTALAGDPLRAHSCQRRLGTSSVPASTSSSGAVCSRCVLYAHAARLARTMLAAALQPKAQAARWQDHSCPSGLLWSLKCSSPPSLNVSFAVDSRRSLQLQKPC